MTSNTADPLARLRALMAMDIEDWNPQRDGEQVLGVVVELDEVEGNFGVFPVVTLQDGDRLVRVAGRRTVLADEIRKRDIAVGDQVGITYDGLRTAQSGTQYYAYRVIHLAEGHDEVLGRPAHATETCVTEPALEESF